MQNISIHNKLELIMARRTATKALKFINTQHSKHTMEYEVTGDL